MERVAVRILHPAPGRASGRLERALEAARSANAAHLARLFEAAGAPEVRIEAGPPDTRTFGERLRDLVAGFAENVGLVVLGSGAIPLARRSDAADLVAVAGSGKRWALANSLYSADVVAVGRAADLASVPDLPSDNALPRWLAEEAGYRVDDLRRRWRLAIDLDSPLDVLLAGGELAAELDTRPVADRLARIGAVAADPRAELLVAGRTSASTLRWLERRTASRTRALVEERGLRAIGLGAIGLGAPSSGGGGATTPGAGAAPRRAGAETPAPRARSPRPARSALGMVLDDRGPQMLGAVLSQLGDAALVDTRVLLAHRLGADESGWPAPEDRYASDLLLHDEVRDPWLRALTGAARDAAIPVLLGGHTLVGPGVRLVLGRRR